MNASDGSFADDLGIKMICNGSLIDDVSWHPSPVARYDNSAHHEFITRMWLKGLFLDREAFRNAQRRFAMYYNFNLKLIKANSKNITTKCKDQNCLWRILASIVERDPLFKVRIYNGTHNCSKAMVGMAHQPVVDA